MARLLRWQEKEETIKEVLSALKEGLVVAIPTETFYGLAVDPKNEEALRRLFHLKRRPEEKPVLLLIGDLKDLEDLVSNVPPLAKRLMRRFWPGPLTLVLPSREGLPRFLTAGTGKIAVRLSPHPVVRCLTQRFGPLTGTSANPSGTPPARSASEVKRLLPGVDLIVDAGKTGGKRPSTILEVSGDTPRLLREGEISWTELERVLREEDA